MLSNDTLRDAGLQLMERVGKRLTKVESGSRAMLYKTPTGETVRLRTSNDHALITRTFDESVSLDSKLNIEGTDWLLLVMPEIERTAGNVIAYLVPSHEAANDVRKAHNAWLATKPLTNGKNQTPVIWFDGDANLAWQGFGRKWNKYRVGGGTELVQARDNAVKAEVESARQRIAEAAGVSRDAVKIIIEFAARGN